MKILIDIGHPAHVHYFKNFIWGMRDKGHEVNIIARNKEVVFELLDNYRISYIKRGVGADTIFGKLIYLLKTNIQIFKIAKGNNPDLALSFASPYFVLTSIFLRVPHITFDDTEHASFEQMFFLPFSKVVLTPSCYLKTFGKKQLRFNGYMELCYLFKNYFKPNPEVLNEIGLTKDEHYVLIRFVSWKASHDLGQKGLTDDFKIELVNELQKHSKIFISSEYELPEELKKFQIRIRPEQLHSILFYATLYIGEGATTASECAVLGTPAIYVNSLNAGTLIEQEKYGMISNFRNNNYVLGKALEFLETPNLREEYQKRRFNMLEEKIDVTAFMIWFIENYPDSVKIMKESPDYQYRFK